ncbi:MAG: hypothetical protein P4M11_13435 [Candidatus Pacebacteria bacterium]|nr:hypothetical protein [Candidatus Paceibacterota bacterium]
MTYLKQLADMPEKGAALELLFLMVYQSQDFDKVFVRGLKI